MAPTFVFKDSKLLLVTGTPGGSRIPNIVLQVILNVVDHGMSVAEAVAAPRIHHQWLPDEVFVEREFPQAAMRALQMRGHKVTPVPPPGSANSIMVKRRGPLGAADARTRGALAAGY